MRRIPILLLSLAFALPAAGTPKDELYRTAQRDLDSGRWGQAIEKFDQVAKGGGAEADAALYWKAYAENKAGRPQPALATLRQLSGAHPKSEWIDDAKALEVEIRGGGGHGGDDGEDGLSEDDELKLYALDGLMGRDPARALPMLQKFLQGNHPPRLKEQALFVLSQGDAPEARKILLDVARGSAHPELQLRAVEYLGIAGGDENVKVLDDLYRTSSRPEVQRAVLDAYLIAKQTESLFAIARDAQDPNRRLAISLLGPLNAGKELRQLASSSDPEVRKAVAEAFFIQGNARALIELFRAEKDRQVRREIVNHLSLMDSDEAEKFLAKIYED